MDFKKIMSVLNEYRQLNDEIAQFRLNYPKLQAKAEQETGPRYDALSNNVQRFCGNESFRSVIRNFCYLYSNVLSVSGGNLAYRGVVPAAMPITSDNVFSLAEKCVHQIKESFQILAQKRGDADTEIKRLCVAFVTLRTVNARIDELKAQAVETVMALEQNRIDAVKQRLNGLLKEYPMLADPERMERQLTEYKQGMQRELDRFHFRGLSLPVSYTDAVSLPFARKSETDEHETGLAHWNPTRDGILHVNIPSGRYEIASDFIIGLTLQFLHSYPLMHKQILYCCQDSLSRMDSFLKTLKDTCKDKVFFHGVDQIEANAFYQEVSECMTYLRGEVRRRSSLMDATDTEDIYEYNSTDGADIISPILVILHDYPTGFSGCRDLGFFFRECAKYGVFFVVLQTARGDQHVGMEMCDPFSYRGIHCELHEDGAHLDLDNEAYTCVHAERSLIRPLLSELVRNAEAGKKINYLSYEEIGFGTTDRNADGYCTKLSIPIGKMNNKTFSLDFATSPSDEDKKAGIKTPLAYLVVGGPGSGKSALIDALVINGSMAYSPDDLIFYLLDFKDGVTASFYDGEDAIPHVRMIASKNKEEDSDIILSGLIEEKERRNALFKDSGTADITGYNGKSNQKIPRIIVIVDECQNLFASDLLAEKCEKLAREGRSAGIHLVLASQDAKLNMMQHAGKFIDGRFCFFTPEKNDAAQVVNHIYTNALSVDVPKGSGLAWLSLENGENCEKIQVAFHGGDKSGNKAEYNRQIREKWMKRNYGIHLIKAGESSPLLLSGYSEVENPLVSSTPSAANIGENFFDHSRFEIDLSKETSHSVLMLGDREKTFSDILTSVITKALAIGGEVKLIDESMDLSLASFFGSHPNVTTYTKESYMQVLAEVFEEFERRRANFRAKYRPYFFIINRLNRIDDYKNDTKQQEQKADEKPDIASFNGDIMALYASMTASKSDSKTVFGKTTLLSMLSGAGGVGNMYFLISNNSELSPDYDERNVFAGCGYKILQHDVSAVAYQVMDNSFREKMMDGLNQNIVFVANRGSYAKCRYYQYDWEDRKTKDLIVSAAKSTVKAE